MISESLNQLQNSLQMLPGIGEKTASRLAMFIVNTPKEKALNLSVAISNAIEKCKPCHTCFILSDTSPCSICLNTSRDNNILCVVENSRDVFFIESTKEFNGKYFVLGNLLSPIDGIGPNEIRIRELLLFISEHPFKEIILAISPSAEGETTIQYISNNLTTMGHKITRLSTGMPYGSDMEYTASATIINALRRRFPV